MTQTLNVGARSVFVTVTAWIFIALAALASASAVVQNAAVSSILPGGSGANLPPVPLLTSLLISYLPWVVGAGLVVSFATLLSAVGLLMRIDAARRVFIGLMSLAIVANLLGLWLQNEVLQSLVASTLNVASLTPRTADVVGGFVVAARLMAALVTLGACGMFAWIINRLMSPSVRQEFA